MTAGRRTLATALFGAAATLLLTAAPYGIGADGFAPQAATAAPGNNGSPGGSNSGRGNSGNSGSGNSAGDKDNSGNTGRGGATSPGTGPGPASIERGRATPNSGRRSNQYVNPQTGTRLEIDGSNIQLVHRDGIREEIVGGRYRMNDAQGRIIIERVATERDRARFRAMIR